MSLVTTPTRSLAVCARCAGRRVTAITMTLTDGTSVDFASCHSCESRSWRSAGRELDIATVLGKAQKHKPAQHVPAQLTPAQHVPAQRTPPRRAA